MLLTMELEKQREEHLGIQIKTALEQTDYERWTWEAWTEMSSTWLHSPPDHFGFIKDPLFVAIMATFLGEPCPAVALAVGRFFGKNGARVDKDGANLASAVLPGQGHRVLHNKLQSIVQAMMNLGGVHLEKEAVNFLLGKVGKPHITSYVNHAVCEANPQSAAHAIVPDIHAQNFHVERQTVDDTGANCAVEAFFEVKTYAACKTRYDKNNRTHPADQRARLVAQSYSWKFKKLDRVFATDVVGDGTNHVVGPFETA